IEGISNAVRLSPVDPLIHLNWQWLAHAHYMAGRDDVAVTWAARASRENARGPGGWRIWAASAGMTGRKQEAAQAPARLQELNPGVRLSNLRSYLGPYRRPEDIARYEEGLRRAGLPE